MATRVEDGVSLTVTDMLGTGTQFEKIPRSKDIESVYMVIDSGALTIATANTEFGCLLDCIAVKFQWDNEEISLIGRHIAAYVSYWYPDEPVRIGAGSYRDAAAAASFGNLDVVARLKINCPSGAGFLNITFQTLGEAYVSETEANTSIASSTVYFLPNYGSFNHTIAVGYLTEDAVSSKQAFYPPVLGENVAAMIATGFADRDNFVADGTADAECNYPAQNYETDTITEMEVQIGATEIHDIATYPSLFQTGKMIRMGNDGAGGNAACYIPLADLIVPVEVEAGGNAFVQINANTADVLLTTIFTKAGPAAGQRSSRTVSTQKPGPAGESSAPGADAPRPTTRQPRTKRGPMVKFGPRT